MMRCLQLEMSVLNNTYMLAALAIAAREPEKRSLEVCSVKFSVSFQPG